MAPGPWLAALPFLGAKFLAGTVKRRAALSVTSRNGGKVPSYAEELGAVLRFRETDNNAFDAPYLYNPDGSSLQCPAITRKGRVHGTIGWRLSGGKRKYATGPLEKGLRMMAHQCYKVERIRGGADEPEEVRRDMDRNAYVDAYQEDRLQGDREHIVSQVLFQHAVTAIGLIEGIARDYWKNFQEVQAGAGELQAGLHSSASEGLDASTTAADGSSSAAGSGTVPSVGSEDSPRALVVADAAGPASQISADVSRDVADGRASSLFTEENLGEHNRKITLLQRVALGLGRFDSEIVQPMTSDSVQVSTEQLAERLDVLMLNLGEVVRQAELDILGGQPPAAVFTARGLLSEAAAAEVANLGEPLTVRAELNRLKKWIMLRGELLNAFTMKTLQDYNILEPMESDSESIPFSLSKLSDSILKELQDDERMGELRKQVDDAADNAAGFVGNLRSCFTGARRQRHAAVDAALSGVRDSVRQTQLPASAQGSSPQSYSDDGWGKVEREADAFIKKYGRDEREKLYDFRKAKYNPNDLSQQEVIKDYESVMTATMEDLLEEELMKMIVNALPRMIRIAAKSALSFGAADNFFSVKKFKNPKSDVSDTTHGTNDDKLKLNVIRTFLPVLLLIFFKAVQDADTLTDAETFQAFGDRILGKLWNGAEMWHWVNLRDQVARYNRSVKSMFAAISSDLNKKATVVRVAKKVFVVLRLIYGEDVVSMENRTDRWIETPEKSGGPRQFNWAKEDENLDDKIAELQALETAYDAADSDARQGMKVKQASWPASSGFVSVRGDVAALGQFKNAEPLPLKMVWEIIKILEQAEKPIEEGGLGYENIIKSSEVVPYELDASGNPVL